MLPTTQNQIIVQSTVDSSPTMHFTDLPRHKLKYVLMYRICARTAEKKSTATPRLFLHPYVCVNSNSSSSEQRLKSFSCVRDDAGLADAAAVPLEAVEEEAKGPNPFALWIEFIRSSVLGINDFYKGEGMQSFRATAALDRSGVRMHKILENQVM